MKVESFKIIDWEDSEQGLLITENENWILVKHIPVDYVVDGYKLYKKGFCMIKMITTYDRCPLFFPE